MDIRHLRYFIAISEAPSLSAAAQVLGVAQPSLSQYVQRMEQELGVQLVERSPRGTMLTEEGHLLVRHAREICASMEHCISEMRDLGGGIRGKVGFGMPPSVSMVMSVPLAETVRVELPDVRLRAIEAMSGYIKSWIEDETVDIGFIYDLEKVEHFRIIHVLDEQLFFFSAPDTWPLDTPPGTPVPMQALEKLEMILPGVSHGLRKTIERHAAACDVDLNVVIEMDAMTQIKELVARGSGHTIFAPAAVHDFVARGELLKAPIVEPTISRPVYLVSKPARSMSRACRAVEQITLEVARDLVRRGIWEGDLIES
ncbi:LysR family transcriptional regulator [Stappia sp. WLB 29]|uniref:LysR family transcriptional regulator n=1 Tax=Stappia sp. WLB 29 TaxID=2925220 RepID=UPI0020BFC488|nr:LysR family transcriptional regulator [Stappia sp. WLB 29]